MAARNVPMRRELIYGELGFLQLRRNVTVQRPAIVALLDGTVDETHPVFHNTAITQYGDKAVSDHATAMASLLAGHSNSGADIELLTWNTLITQKPDSMNEQMQAVRIRNHLIQACVHHADVIVLGFEFISRSAYFVQCITDALIDALQSAIPVVVPAGNHGGVVDHPLLQHPAVVPVTMVNDSGTLASSSAWGPCVATRGLRAPGHAIPVALPGNRFQNATGTSFASAFAAAGIAAILARRPLRSGRDIFLALRRCANRNIPSLQGTRTIPPAFNVWTAYQSIVDHQWKECAS